MMSSQKKESKRVTGKFVDFAGERFYQIGNVDAMSPFFISLVSSADHWLFCSSNGGLTAGRCSPEQALFPYVTVDKIYDSPNHTGSRSVFRVTNEKKEIRIWEPFNSFCDGIYALTRNLYKNTLGNRICYEEFNQDLQLVFRCTWETSDTYGFVRSCELLNMSTQSLHINMLDGMVNILPAGTPRFLQTNASYLVDAYKWNELDQITGLGVYALYSGITDRPEPFEVLRASTVFCLGLDNRKTLLSSRQIERFRHEGNVEQEAFQRGVRGAYLVNTSFKLSAGTQKAWTMVADVEQSQSDVVSLQLDLRDPLSLKKKLEISIAHGDESLSCIMARADGFQISRSEDTAVHHYANALFNVLRGGIFYDGYSIPLADLVSTIAHFNRALVHKAEKIFSALPEKVTHAEIMSVVRDSGDMQLERLCNEYLPITFGRRHGDPSRPWNVFEIKIKDHAGQPLLSYQGNWRDIFQNWEALGFSYPEFIEQMIAKFVNASTIEGYNPYRISKEGIDWEVEDPKDPWSSIGYWGDHQIIYLLKLLELSSQFHPDRLQELLYRDVFSYANVPYRIKSLKDLVKNSKDTVFFDQVLADQIDARVREIGADGKLVLDKAGCVYQVNLIEKLLVPLLSKLGNMVVGGGIWLNTQRPEWNDANNAIVGQGLSMVTLYYLRRYIVFFQQLLRGGEAATQLSIEVSDWLLETLNELTVVRPFIGKGRIHEGLRYRTLLALGEAASRYRLRVYHHGFSGRKPVDTESIFNLLEHALAVVEHSINVNKREDGLYHSYNTMILKRESLTVDMLYPMLEGQVAILSSGALSAKQCIEVLEALFASDMYCSSRDSFMLYPDRSLPTFLEKNIIEQAKVEDISLLRILLDTGDEEIVLRDAKGRIRFNAEIINADELIKRLNSMRSRYGMQVDKSLEAVVSLYAEVFKHQEFTGRSGGMFGFEGLGCIYWHMVSKLLLAVQENFFWAIQQGADNATLQRLGQLYYRVRQGIGFNKSPQEYGAFPTDPYSHTPKHIGAQQPGMTGQVKEEVLTRFGELGVRVQSGKVMFWPGLLRNCEFTDSSKPFRYLDVDSNWQELTVPAGALAFTWCQVPILYQLDDTEAPLLTINWDDGTQTNQSGYTLSAEHSGELFRRSGRIRGLHLMIDPKTLFAA